MEEEREIEDSRDMTSLGLMTWLKYLIITCIDYLKENKGLTLYLLE
jgi:hypothetical protein